MQTSIHMQKKKTPIPSNEGKKRLHSSINKVADQHIDMFI